MSQEEQGFNPGRYQVIPRTLIFLFDEKRVLLIKGRPDKKIWAGLYNGLGGHIEDGEDVLSAARRELLEESGIADSHLMLCGIISINLEKSRGIILFVFKGQFKEGSLVNSDEGTLEWVDLSRLDDLPVVEDLRTILPLVYEHQREDLPFYARYHYDQEGKLVIEINDKT